MILSAYLFADGVELAPDSIAVCADAIRAGELMGLPTETVYGLGADADNASAVAKVFAAKGRPADHPLIVHVASFDGGMGGVAHFAQQVPAFAQQLMSAFWPGPLTLILPRRDGVGAAAAGGQNSIGLRCPDHPVAQAVLSALRKPRPSCCKKSTLDSVGRSNITVSISGKSMPSLNRSTENSTANAPEPSCSMASTRPNAEPP